MDERDTRAVRSYAAIPVRLRGASFSSAIRAHVEGLMNQDSRRYTGTTWGRRKRRNPNVKFKS